MNLPKSFTIRTFAVIAVSVFIYAAIMVFVGWEAVTRELSHFPQALYLPLTLLTCGSYALRFWRWEFMLRRKNVRLPLRESIGLYFATYLMVITPGKIGEVLKAGILNEKFGVSLTLALPIVLAERVYDFLAVLILAVIGLFYWPGSLSGLTTGLVAAGALPMMLVLFQTRAVRDRLVRKVAASPMLRRHQVGIDQASEHLSGLLSLRLGAIALIVSCIAWLGEAVGLWLACHGLAASIPLGQAVFVYAVGTIVGSLSFLPGGLGGTEAIIIWLLQSLALSRTTAATVALLVRLFTLWLAVGVGLGFFLGFRYLFAKPPTAPGPPGESAIS